MKSSRLFISAFVGLLLVFDSVARVSAQSQEVQQLLLNVEKLSQFKNILRDMKAGYEIISTGYNAVRDISKGNFSLYETFLDGLLAVSPEVRKYHKIVGIVSAQGRILSEYKVAFSSFRSSDKFNVKEIDYLGSVYGNLNKQSLANLEALLMVITAGHLRMSDDERLAAIDAIYSDMQEKLLFLRHFNAQGLGIARQRKLEQREVDAIKDLYTIHP
ncbi:TerB family tellurite resistance protein [Pedobacter psychroterrae]|uniref:TerB family tellurite resistance protein n=1 Tax=Pedobacter psychroterrae TaxID=2530453 RepID=A0A4R0NQ78_9SPHI|nr:TerB family tellurite resistance protein [Pedobacter psychroterrae]TCD03171.1 TerB family tellurite resistance protein [Pedobacter psychroterrae]